MARPKANLGENSAENRITEAFWKILRDGSYADVTIKRLAMEADVNHKTIYYHFGNVDGLAKVAFDKNLSEAEPQVILSAVLTGSVNSVDFFGNERLFACFQRLRLFMREDSAYLNGIVRETLLSQWLQSVGKSEEDLSSEEKTDLNFIISGLIAVLGSENYFKNAAVSTLSQRPIGIGIFNTLKGLTN